MVNNWHRARLIENASSQSALGFYDSLYQIAIFPSEEVSPSVVIDHEITHVNLVNNTSLGLLEKVISALLWNAQEYGKKEAAAELKLLLRVVYASTELVHEAIAWLGTELQTEGYENKKAPVQYTREVQRLRHLFTKISQRSPLPIQIDFVVMMEIAESIGCYALNPPCIAELWSNPEQISVEFLQTLLQSPLNNPLTRFKQICAQLETVSLQEVQAWSHVQSSLDPDLLEKQRILPKSSKKHFLFRKNIEQLPTTFRLDLEKTGNVQVIKTLANRLGFLEYYESSGSLDEHILKLWESFNFTHTFQPSLDRYAQVVVLETRKNWREFVYSDSEDARKTLSESLLVIVSVMRGELANLNFPSYEKTDPIILTGYPKLDVSTEISKEPLHPTWRTDLESANAFLTGFSKIKPVIASSIAYDFGEGDFKGRCLLRNIPHVVVTIRDFRSLWFAISFLGDKGLRNCKEIEWFAMPSLSGQPNFGYLLLKPANHEFPIVINPCVISEYNRILTVVDQMNSPYDIHLIRSAENPYIRLGSMMKAVAAATGLCPI